MATAAIIRENLSKALEYMDKQSKAENDPDMDMPDFDAKLEALVGVLRGELPVHCHAHRADDIATAVRICREFGLRLVVVHGTEGHLISELLARENIPVITGPCLTDRCKPELMNQTIENPALLSRAGVKVAICTDSPGDTHPVPPLLRRHRGPGRDGRGGGPGRHHHQPRRDCGSGKRVGSLAVGKDADVVVTSRHPWTGRAGWRPCSLEESR